jgi:hypothetical protein
MSSTSTASAPFGELRKAAAVALLLEREGVMGVGVDKLVILTAGLNQRVRNAL